MCLRTIHDKSVPAELLSWRPLDPNELSGSTHSLDRDSLSSFATTSSTATGLTSSVKEQSMQLDRIPTPDTPTPEVMDEDTVPPVTNGTTSVETEPPHEVEESNTLVVKEDGQVSNASTEETVPLAQDTPPGREGSPEIKDEQDDKLPLLREEELSNSSEFLYPSIVCLLTNCEYSV